MIVYELILNRKPFKDIKSLYNLAKRIEDGERPPIEGPISNSFKNLIESCWAQDPNKRPSFKNIIDQMKNDEGFITELVDEDKYYDFIEQMDEIKTEFIQMPDLNKDDYENLSPEKMFQYAKNKEANHEYEEARRCYLIASTTAEKIGCRYYQLKECRDSMFNYALMCKNGIGGPVDIPTYIEYLKRAANYALPQASYEYGLELEKGEFVAKNLNLAAMYFRSSADYSYPQAISKYVECLSKGIGVKKNVFNALKYCKKMIRKERSIAYQNILDHINDIDETNDVNEIIENDNINMKNGFIFFNDKKDKNDFSKICSGSKSLDEQLIELEKHRSDVYPQGFEKCKNLLIQQKNKNGTVMVCSAKTKPHWTTFYFELPFDEGRLLFNKIDIDIELDKIKYRGRNDIYPQGYNYIQNLLHKKKANKDDCIRVFSRKISPSSNVLYYFKTKYIMKLQSDVKIKPYFEGVFL